MIDLPKLEDYSESELKEAAEHLPAVSRYLSLIQKEFSEPADQLRIRRHQHWLKCALSTYFQKSSPKDICAYWSEAADDLLSKACEEVGLAQEGLALFALGKLGSEELNLSSDVDILFIARSDVPLAKVRAFNQFLSEQRRTGFCFRVDMDLRPGGTQGPMVPTYRAFEDYYGNYGETWERLAFIRLRPIWGDKALIKEVQEFTAKFTYRRHLDYTLLSDLQSLRQKIHRHYKSAEDRTNLKLDAGGIRDIELFTHALLVIHGGKQSLIRKHKTEEALEALSLHGLINPEDAESLVQAYWKYRELENLIQVERDLQCHHLLKKRQSYEPEWTKPLREELPDLLKWVDEHVREVIGEIDKGAELFPEDESTQKKWLSEKLSLTEEYLNQYPELLQAPIYSKDTARDRKIRQEFLSVFLQELKEISPHLESSLLFLDEFLKATKAKATLYTLLLREDALRQSLAKLFSYSPFLSQVLCHRPELLDGLLLRQQAPFSEDPALQSEEFSERKMLTEILAGMEFLNDGRVDKLSNAFSNTADVIADCLLSRVSKETGCDDIDILCLGKWGGRELGFKSDLDFVFVTEHESEAPCFKAARRFLNRITENVKGGRLYSVDMRLRPSGKAGPMLVTKKQLLEFLANTAEPWQRQAYLKARSLKFALDAEIRKALLIRSLNDEDLKELSHIKDRIFTEKNTRDIKYSPGGLIDIELSVQAAVLCLQVPTQAVSTSAQIAALSQSRSAFWKDLGEELGQNYLFLRQVQQLIRLSGNSSTTMLDGVFIGPLARLLFELEPEKLMHRVWEIVDANVHHLKDLDPRRGDK